MFSKLIALLVFGFACEALHTAPFDSTTNLLKSVQRKGSANILISFAGRNSNSIIRNEFKTQKFSSREQKLNAFYSLLKGHSDQAQLNVLNVLEKEKSKRPITVRQLWITNQIIVKNADFSLVETLLAMEDVTTISEEKFISLEQPTELVVQEENPALQVDEQWGVINIRAPEVWASGFRGAGAVVAIVDTGVRGTHNALRDGYRADYGWLDPSDNTSTTPNDGNGHGTHIAGTIAGRLHGIGVAPEAQWVACKGCGAFSCSESDLLECGQWVACPTDTEGNNPDCSKAPHAVSNGWGSGGESRFFDAIIDAWVAVDIVPFFNTGSAGDSCKTISSPGDYEPAMAVAATDESNEISSSSSNGPNYLGQIKPNIAAPATNILSAFSLSDTSYATLSGSTAAPPHAAGLVALLVSSVEGKATYQELRRALQEGAQPVSATGNTCGGIADNIYPNNHAGHGRIDAVASVALLKKSMGKM